MIAARALTRSFGPRTVVRDVTFEVAQSEIVALLGPNGAGKTTTMRMLAGLIAPTSGSVTIDGVALTPASGGTLRGRIGFLTETPGLWDRLTVRENLQIYASIYRLEGARRVIDASLDLFELTDHASARAAELSKGMRQKVALARALLHRPTSVRRLLDERRSAGCSILVSTHNLDEAERMADRVALLHERLIAIDRPAALRQRLHTGHVTVRLATAASAYLHVARQFDPGAESEGGTLVVHVRDGERDTPVIVSALAAAGAPIVEVRHETPALEDVYLHLIGDAPQ